MKALDKDVTPNKTFEHVSLVDVKNYGAEYYSKNEIDFGTGT